MFQRLLKVPFLLLFVFFTTACGAVPVNYAPPIEGNVVEIAAGTVNWAVTQILTSSIKLPGREVIRCGDWYIFAWFREGEMTGGFWGIDLSGRGWDYQNAIRGNLAGAKSVQGVIDQFVAQGWVKVAPKEMVPAASAAILQFLASRLMMAPVMMLSVGAFDGGFDAWFEDTFEAAGVEL